MESNVNQVVNHNHAHRGKIKICDGKILATQTFEGEQHVMRVQCPEIVTGSEPGNFVHVKCSNELSMRRPKSIMRASPREGWNEFLFKTVGKGTDLLAKQQVGAIISIMGPIGTHFKLSGYRKKPILIGGGVGIPPMVYLAENMKRQSNLEPLVLMGSEIPFPFPLKPSQIMTTRVPSDAIAAMPLLEDWGICSRLASNQGYAGCFDGFVTDLAKFAILSSSEQNDIELFACGPTAMLKVVQSIASEYDIPCQISLEEHMACAVGGCAGCAVEISTPEGKAMKRVCVDGPIFEAENVIFGGK